jgi:hypothetical protein
MLRSQETCQVVVQFNLPPHTTAGRHPFRLDACAVENPDEWFAVGPEISCSHTPPPPPEKPSFKVSSLLLKLFIGFLSVTALMAIISLVVPGFWTGNWKVMATTLSVSAGSVCAMSCGAYLERKSRKWIGLVGIILSALAVLLFSIGIWTDTHDDTFAKSIFTLIVLSLAVAHFCLMQLAKLLPGHRWVQLASGILVGSLALQIIFAILISDMGENYYRCLGAVAVLVCLISLVIPLLGRLRARSEASNNLLPDQLLLSKVEGSVFADQGGRRYQVMEV